MVPATRVGNVKQLPYVRKFTRPAGLFGTLLVALAATEVPAPASWAPPNAGPRRLPSPTSTR